MKRTIILTIIALVCVTIRAQETKLIKVFADKSKSSITYSMNHPLHAWTGENKDVTSVILTDENKTLIKQVAVSVRIESFDSKNANRDSHTIEVTEAIKFPKITFASSNITQEGDILKVTGTLNFHGIAQTISFEATKSKIKDKLQVSGNFTIQMTNFKIEPPSLMGMATDDDIKISFKMVY